MSSTTSRRQAERGQVLIIFAFGIVGILAIAALVFDVGQMLFDKRRHQDAADAAALAGARFLTLNACKANGNCSQAEGAAMALALEHGYASSQIHVNIPPTAESQFAGLPGHIQVTIDSTHGSFFAGIFGMLDFRVAALAVAANTDGYPLPYSFLALNRTACKAGHLAGNGTMEIAGDVMVSSDCTAPGALSFDGGNVVVDVTGACSTAGDIDYGPSDTTRCVSENEGVPAQPDPLAGLQGPKIGGTAVPNPPADMIVTGTHLASNKPEPGCPGSTSPATSANPTGCSVHYNRPKTVRMFPGVYWGGLKLQETGSDDLTVYMEPGIYYMAGGGFEVSGELVLRTVDGTVDDSGTAFGGGVMIYNTDGPTCQTLGTACIAAIDFQNTAGGDGEVRLRGYQGPVYTQLLVFQDRDASSQPAISLEGHGATTFEGTIYAPEATFKYTGLAGGLVFGAQVICDTFMVSGNGGLTVTYDPEDAVQLRGTGLVQ